MASWSRKALAASCLIGLGYTLHVYRVSPDVVPVHYGPTGVPDRWGTPGELLVVHWCIIGLGTALFLALPELIRRAPQSLINLPNKEYWLSPAHREEATAKFARWANVLGTAVNSLVVALQLVLDPNRNGAVSAPGPLLSFVMIAFVLFTVCSCIWLGLSYRLPARTE